MRGTIVKRVSHGRHYCKTPTWRERRRRKADLDVGSVWRCPCGQAWELTNDESGTYWTPVRYTWDAARSIYWRGAGYK